MIRKLAHPGRKPKRDAGATTKAQLLEAAGEVFAAKGFLAATGKEITERAGCNSAAINYHFGGIGELYGEVLVEAHHRLVSIEELATLANSASAASDKLASFIVRLTRLSVAPGPAAWPLRVISRELLSPSPYFTVLMEREILPKKRIALELIASYLGVAPDDPAAGMALLSFIAPFLALLVGNQQMLRNVAPKLFDRQAEPQEIMQHFSTFAFGGLEATRARLEKERGAGKMDANA